MGILSILFITLFIVFYPLEEITRVPISDAAISLIDITVALIAVIYFSRKILKKEKIEGVLIKPIIIFTLILVLSLILNISKLNLPQLVVSALYLLRWAVYASMYFVIKDMGGFFKKNIYYFLVASGSLVLAGGFLQFFFYPDIRNLYYLGWDEHLYRLFSSFLDPNFAGAFFVLYLILIFVLYLKEKKRSIFSHYLLVAILLSIIAIALTFSRAAYIMLAVGLLILWFLKRDPKVFLVILISIFAILISLKVVLHSEGTNILRTASGNSRIDSVNKALVIFKDNPVLGVGFDAYRYAQRRYGFINEDKRLIHSAAGTDNSFLFVLATSGIIGLLGFMSLIYNLLKLSLVNLRNNSLSIVLFASIISLCINSFFLNSLFYPPIMLWLWILAGLTEST